MRNDKNYYVYLLSTKRNKMFYIGVTNNLIKRVYEHRNKLINGFSNKFNIAKLVYYECFDNPENAITREKHLKKWNREWKIILSKNSNPSFKDLYNTISI
jgi:putative endonuclease